MSDRDDFRLLIEGRITSKEYVRRLDKRINERRLGDRMAGRTPRPWRGLTPKQAARVGFWDGVRSALTFGRR